MDEKAGAQISRRAFFQSAVILYAVMMMAGILTQVADLAEVTRQTAVTAIYIYNRGAL